MLELKNVNLKRGNRLILSNISASAEAGSITLLLGENGCGKTSLLGGISGILPIESGAVSLDGSDVDLSSADWPGRLSYVFDDGGTIPLLSIEEQLVLQCLLNKVDKTEAASRTDTVIRLLNLEKHREYRADELSAGLRKRLGIGIGLVRNAEIFLFDEPFSSLDLQSGMMILRLLETLKKLGKTVILSTHSPDFLSDIFDSVWVLSDGGIKIHDNSYSASGRNSRGFSDEALPSVIDLPWMAGGK